MKKIERITEVKKNTGALIAVEVTFEDDSMVIYKSEGEMNRKGALRPFAIDLTEFRNMRGALQEIEITFQSGEKINYKSENMRRQGNL
jgi:hypothetical protein